jgi:hypothetical protein
VVYRPRRTAGYAGYRRGLRSFGTWRGTGDRGFDSSGTMTTAMTQRGYDGSMPPKQKPFRRVEGRSPAGCGWIGLSIRKVYQQISRTSVFRHSGKRSMFT